MADNRDTRRAEKLATLRERLIEAAERQIAASGLRELKAREVTAEAGCALGALYTAVEDLDHLVLWVNARTLARMRDWLVAAMTNADPTQMMQAMARAYIAFARANTRLWWALFDFTPAPGMPLPEWFLAEQEALLGLIARPLQQVFPDLDAAGLRLRSRTFFGAVQGAVQLALQNRFVAVPHDALDAEVSAMVAALAGGFRAG